MTGYPGAKTASGVVQRIVNQIPPHDVFIEAFAGSATVALSMRPATQTYLIEKNPLQIPQLKLSMRSAIVIEGCALSMLQELVERVSADGAFRVFVYCDPPYVLDTRAKKNLYGQFELSDIEHRQLCQVLSSLPASVAISGYPSALYSEELTGWRCDTYQVMTRGGPRPECLWMNYSQPKFLHDYSYAGRNHTDRQRISRKINRWLKKFEALEAIERGAIFTALQDSYSCARFSTDISDCDGIRDSQS